MVTVVRRITRPNLLRETSVSIQRQRHDSTGVGGKAPVVERGGGGRGKSGHPHASRDVPVKGPLGSKSGERWDTGGSNGQLFMRCLTIDKKSRDKKGRDEEGGGGMWLIFMYFSVDGV